MWKEGREGEGKRNSDLGKARGVGKMKSQRESVWYQEGLRERRIGCTTCHRPFFLKEVEKTIERRWKRKKQRVKWEEEGGTQQV